MGDFDPYIYIFNSLLRADTLNPDILWEEDCPFDIYLTGEKAKITISQSTSGLYNMSARWGSIVIFNFDKTLEEIYTCMLDFKMSKINLFGKVLKNFFFFGLETKLTKVNIDRALTYYRCYQEHAQSRELYEMAGLFQQSYE